MSLELSNPLSEDSVSIMKAIMKFNIIFLTLLITNCYAVVYKKLYQDHTSWSFQHPTSTWTNARFNRNNAKYIASYPIGNADDAISKDVRLSFVYLAMAKN